MNKDTISVIVPVKNEEATLNQLLTILFEQTLLPDEIIVIDAGSSDSSITIVENLQKKHPELILIKAPNSLPGKARNEGIKISKGNIIAQIDSGIYIGKDWLQLLVSPILQGVAEYTYGKVLPMEQTVSWLKVRHDIPSLFESFCNITFRDEQYIAGGASVCYKKYIWEKVGGQPEWLRRGEDILFVRNVKMLNIKFLYVRNCICYWQTCTSLKSAFLKKFIYIVSEFILPYPTYHKKMIGIKTLLMSVLIIACFFIPGITTFILILFAGYFIKRVYNSSRSYRVLTENKPSLPYIFLLPILFILIIIYFFIEQIAIFTGPFFRLLNNDLYNKAKDYYHSSLCVTGSENEIT